MNRHQRLYSINRTNVTSFIINTDVRRRFQNRFRVRRLSTYTRAQIRFSAELSTATVDDDFHHPIVRIRRETLIFCVRNSISLTKKGRKKKNRIFPFPPHIEVVIRPAALRSRRYVLSRHAVVIDETCQLRTANIPVVNRARMKPCVQVVCFSYIYIYHLFFFFISNVLSTLSPHTHTTHTRALPPCRHRHVHH